MSVHEPININLNKFMLILILELLDLGRGTQKLCNYIYFKILILVFELISYFCVRNNVISLDY